MKYDASLASLFHPATMPPLFGVVGGPAASWPEAARCAELARLAYFEPAPAVSEACALAGLRQYTFFNDAGTGTQAFACKAAGGRAYIAFRGTQPNSLYDLVADARFLSKPWRGGGKVHAGFAQCYESVAPQLRDWVKQQAPDQLTLTGHSLGAALATLAASADFTEARLVTFGSPRVGNGEFAARLLRRDVERYIDCCDDVTQVPPCGLLLQYTHLEGARYLNRNGKYLPAAGDFAMAADRARAEVNYVIYKLRPGNVLTRGLADHAMINYISALLGLREA